MAILSYVMQTFLLPKGLCDRLDRMIRKFWWQHDDNNQHLCLKVWDSICTPKLAGGLGVRRFKDINEAYITKLCWQVCAEPSKTWVQLVRSKYLRGCRVLDFNQCGKRASRVWNGLRKCYGSLTKGLCLKVGQKSIIHTFGDPWIPDLSNFTIPPNIPVDESINLVQNLLTSDGKEWDRTLVTSDFPPHISRMILLTHISLGDQDAFVWTPSKSGLFSVKSSYKANNTPLFTTNSRIGKEVWKHLWNSNLHEQHKIFFWKILSVVLPTLDRIIFFVPLADLNCFICRQNEETMHHLIFTCPITVKCWRQSPWALCMHNLAHFSIVDWILNILDSNSSLLQPLPEDGRDHLPHYATILMEAMWQTRNEVRLGKDKPDWTEFTHRI